MGTPDPPLIHYIIVRRDIRRTVRGSGIGALAAQVAHAAGESFAAWEARYHWTPRGTIACVLGVPNERALKHVLQRLDDAGIKCNAIYEPDAPWNGALMAIGVWPMPLTSPARKTLSRLKLL